MSEVLINEKKTKKCSKCHHKISTNDFYKDKYRPDRLTCVCKTCQKQRVFENKDKIRLFHQKYYLENKEKIDLRNKLYNSKNKEKLLLSRKNYENKNREEINTKRRRSYLENKKKIIARCVEYQKNKYKTNPTFRTYEKYRRRINDALNVLGVNKSVHTREGLGCTAFEFKEYIQSLFEPGMNFENNKSRKWHLHHIKPCHTFDLKDPEQQKKCFHYSNIMPMWENEHIALHAKDRS